MDEYRIDPELRTQWLKIIENLNRSLDKVSEASAAYQKSLDEEGY